MIHKRNNIKCSFGCIWANIQIDESSLSLLKSYQQQGFHIMSHPDINNANWNINNSSYNLSLAEQQLIDCVTYLKSQGFIDCEHVVSPGGANSEPIQQMVSKWCPSMIGKNDNTSNLDMVNMIYDEYLLITTIILIIINIILI